MNVSSEIVGDQMGALAKAGEGRREHAVTESPQPVRDARPAPAAMPVAMEQDIGPAAAYQRSAAVCTGASHSAVSSSSSAVTVSEQPAMSSEVQ